MHCNISGVNSTFVSVYCSVVLCVVGGDTIDSSMRKTYTKRGRKRASDEERSSDGEHTLELASSHSSDAQTDEDEGEGHVRIRNATLGK